MTFSDTDAINVQVMYPETPFGGVEVLNPEAPFNGVVMSTPEIPVSIEISSNAQAIGSVFGRTGDVLADPADYSTFYALKNSGVPTGGETGQVLGKISNTNFDFDWIDSSASSWGGITGTLSAQADLQSALDAKQSASANLDSWSALATSAKQNTDTQLTSLAALSYTGNSLKVIRVNAGETDFELATISVGVAWGGITGTLSAQTDLQSVLDAKQPIDSDLTTIAGLTATTDNFIVSVSSAWASRTPSQVRTTLGLVIGTNVQAWDADLDSWAGVTRASGFDTFSTTPSSANLRGLLTDENGTGAALFDGATSPTFVSPVLGTPTTLVGTNITGTAASLTAGNATKWTTGRTIALTGDVTYTSGSLDGSGNVTGTATLANIPTSVPAAGYIDFTDIAAPSSAAASHVRIWGDSTDLRFHDKNAAGTIGTTVVADTGASNNFFTAISAAGVISKAQPAFTNLSGSVAAAQMPALTGDVTTSAGAVATTIANDAVTYAKMQNVTTARLLGRATAGSGDTEEITLGTNLSFTGTTLNAASGGGSLTVGTSAITSGSGTRVLYETSGNLLGEISGATSDGTTMTLTSPKIVTSLLDTNANTLLGVTATGSAVNYLTVANSATSTLGGTIGAAGTGSNLNITLAPKGTGSIILGSGGGPVTIGPTGTPTAGDLLYIGNNTNAVLLDIVNTAVAPTTTLFNVTADLSSAIGNGKAFGITATSETFARCLFYTDGSYGVGPGSSTRDTFLNRSAANTFRISADRATAAADLEITRKLTLGVNTTTLGTVKMFGNTSGDATVQPAAVAGTATVVTLPNASSTLPIYPQQITYTGPSAARTVTYPDAAFTVARTDAANTFTGASTGTSWTMTTPVIAGGLTASGSGSNDFSGSTGTFKTSSGANTLNGTATITPPVRTSGVASYFTLNIPADTGQTAATESIGYQHATASRAWADGTVALQRENFFAGPTYNKTTTSATFTDPFTIYITPPVAGTGVTFTRGHSLGIVDSTSASSSITGGLVVATTLGTTATSVGIGGGNVNAGGNGTFGGTLSVTGHDTLEGVTSTGATGTGKHVYDTSPTLVTPLLGTPTSGVMTNVTGTADGLTAGDVTRNHPVYASASPPTVDVGVFTIVKTGVNMKAAGTTAAFTVPSGRNFVLHSASTIITAVNTPSTGGTFTLAIKESGASGAMGPGTAASTGVPAVGIYYGQVSVVGAAPYTSCAAGNIVNIVISTGFAASTTVTGSVFLTGFYSA